MGGKGSGGGNKKSIEQHIRDGTYRKGRHGDLSAALLEVKERLQSTKEIEQPAKEAASKTPLPECPAWLDENGKEQWVKICQLLQDKGTLHVTDPAAIEGYCEAYSRWRKATLELDKGLLYEYFDSKSFKTKRRQKPEVNIAKDALNQMRAYQNELGLTPKSVVIVTKPEKRSEMDEFLDGLNK